MTHNNFIIYHSEFSTGVKLCFLFKNGLLQSFLSSLEKTFVFVVDFMISETTHLDQQFMDIYVLHCFQFGFFPVDSPVLFYLVMSHLDTP